MALGHELYCSVNDVLKFESIIEGMEVKSNDAFSCETYHEQCETKCKKPHGSAVGIFDLAGPVNPMGMKNYQYAITFTDDFPGVTFVYLLKKSDTTKAFKQFLGDSRQRDRIYFP